MLTTELLTGLARRFGAKPNAAVVAGIVENQHFLIDGGIDTPTRMAEFLAQACLETDYFRVLEEYASGADYEGRKDLGNVVAGDGKRFKGRGIFQCTGRDNYKRYGKRLGLDLLKEPELAERPDVSVRIAVMYWNDKGLNAYADAKNTRAISRAINRGSATSKKAANHEASRVSIAAAAHQAFALVKPAPVAKPIPTPPPVSAPPVLEPTRNDGKFEAPKSERSWWGAMINRLIGREP